MSDSNFFNEPWSDLQWPATETLIPAADASIFLAFHGLMCFAYNRKTGLLEAGMHGKAPDHDFKIFVIGFNGNLSQFSLIYSFEPKSHKIPGGEVTVNISTPRDPGVQFYLPSVEDDYTWAQLLDLEGREFYDCKLKKKPKTLKPKVTVNHGRFQIVATPYRFLRFEEGGQLGTDIGTIAYLPIGMVRHQRVGTLTISTKRETLQLPASKQRPLLVLFANSCPSYECPSGQNDFPFYYKTIKLRRKQKKFRLEPVQVSEKQQLSLGNLSFLEFLFQQELFARILSSTDAPCGAAGYGRSVGVADQP